MSRSAPAVFLNFPYDESFQDLFLAYVAGVCSHGFSPRTTLEIVGGEQRLRRIVGLIQSCQFSFHDLSRVELDSREPIAPRFNMAFETGLAVMHSLLTPPQSHTYFIFETDHKRLQKSLSDLGGTDVYTHGGSVEGVLREVGNALIHAKRRPTVHQMLAVLDQERKALKKILRNSKTDKPYTARVFLDLVLATNEIVNQQSRRRKT